MYLTFRTNFLLVERKALAKLIIRISNLITLRGMSCLGNEKRHPKTDLTNT